MLSGNNEEKGGCMLSRRAPHLEGKAILIVDDEPDVLDTIADMLSMARVDKAQDFRTASEKIEQRKYDLAILDIMGVDGLGLLQKTVKKGIPTTMLTAHAMNVETLIASIQKGAISFLPKEKMADLDHLLDNLMAAVETGKEPWGILFDELAGYFDRKFGPDWKENNKEFWENFRRLIETQYCSDAS
jgi:CheY-like chemotaxis protein